jgi:hypothetical protein
VRICGQTGCNQEDNADDDVDGTSMQDVLVVVVSALANTGTAGVGCVINGDKFVVVNALVADRQRSIID